MITDRDERLWSLGVIMYGLYVVGLILTFTVPAIHQNQNFRKMIEIIKPPAVALSYALATVGIIVMIIGVFIHSEGASYYLVTLAGTAIFVMAQCLRMWATSQSSERQSIYAKAIAISLGCILGLTYIINGADALVF
jgi:protein-S-isoprenylcysteine O-methyltransferase Ste14